MKIAELFQKRTKDLSGDEAAYLEYVQEFYLDPAWKPGMKPMSQKEWEKAVGGN